MKSKMQSIVAVLKIQCYNFFNYFKSLKFKIKRVNKIVILSLFIFTLNTNTTKPGFNDDDSFFKPNKNVTYLSLVRIKLQEELISEVDNYIKLSSPGSKLDARLLVILCQKYNTDIPFVLAQGVLESHLGTKGKAFQTNSVWNVGAYDDGRILHTYKDANDSIEPYLQLLQEKYLGDTKTLKELIRDGGFTNLRGQRYASSLTYEAKMRTYLTYINLNTSISLYQSMINLPDEKILAYFTPLIDSIPTDEYLAFNTN